MFAASSFWTAVALNLVHEVHDISLILMLSSQLVFHVLKDNIANSYFAHHRTKKKVNPQSKHLGIDINSYQTLPTAVQEKGFTWKLGARNKK
jgi:hypothetical protein